MNIYRKLYHIK